jgi:hypothetical protein
VVGTALAVGVLGVLTIGVFVLPAALLGLFGLLRYERTHSGLPGLACGPGVVLLYVAYLNRDGAGNICTTSPSGGNYCRGETSPWPWLVAGLAFVIGGWVAFISRRGR